MKKLLFYLAISILFISCGVENIKPKITLTSEFNWQGSKYVAISAACGSGIGSTFMVNEKYSVIVPNAPSSGSKSVTDEYYTGSCTTCTAIQITNPSTGATFVATTGTVSRSASTITISANMRSLVPSNTTYSLTGTINCN